MLAVGGFTFYYFQASRDNEAPLIEDLEWKPTSVVNDKVYEGAISFKAKDERSIITEAFIHFIPRNYPQLPKEAFSNETEKKYSIIPQDGRYDETIEEFAIDITDMIGGRDYEINATVKDESGNIGTASIVTPYIREFENIAPLDDIQLGTYYYPWYGPGHDVHWNEGYSGHPLLGEYYSGDNVVISKHIDWATGYGIDFFIMSWWGIDTKEDINTNKILTNVLADDIKFCILYESHGVLKQTYGIEAWPVIDMDDPSNVNKFLGHFKYFADNYFESPNYFEIDDSPVVFVYDTGAYVGNLSIAYQSLRDTMNNLGFNICLMADVAGLDRFPRDFVYYMNLHDGISSYTPYSPNTFTHPEFEELMDWKYNLWSGDVAVRAKDFIPTICPGYNKTDYCKTQHISPCDPVMERNAPSFGDQIEIAVKYMKGVNMFLICSWNEFHEGTHIEPTKEEGFTFLKTLKNYLTAPSIHNLSWSPSDVRNDKIYSLNAEFGAKDIEIGSESPGIKNAELQFIPKEYPSLPKRAFPEDEIRKYKLTPLDGSYGDISEKFSVNITDIIGGREYEVRITVTDNDGNERTSNFNTPYIREFENLGKQLYEKGTKIGIFYGLIAEKFEWDNPLELGLPYEPLLGYYLLNSTEDLMVIEKHMDWMSGHGINFVLFLWPERVMREGNIRERVYKEAISTLDIFKTGGMKFGILYGFEGEPPFNMSDPQRVQSLKEDLSYLAENYFGHPACFKINGKPFFYIWGTPAMGGDFIGALKEAYEFMKENYGIQLYVVSDHAGPEVDENWGGSGGEGTPYIPVKDWVPRFFDAMLTTPSYKNPEYASYEEYLETGFKYWYPWSLRHGLDYIPFVNPGGSMKYCSWQLPEMRESDPMAYPRSIELWKKRIEMSIPYSNTFGIMVGDFNNVFENGHIEPTVQEGFGYLEAMKEVLTEYFLT